MISFDDTVLEKLFEKPYWIVDILPKQVPKDSAGQYAAVEQYCLRKPGITELRKKYLAIFLKLNCYYDLAASIDGGEHWSENPAPKKLEEWMLSDAGVRTLYMMILSQDTLMVMDFDDTCMTVYNPEEEVFHMLRMLSGSEGLFLWQPESQV